MKKLKPTDLTDKHLELICDIINRGNQAEIKRERENVVIVEIKRTALIKTNIEQVTRVV